MPSRMSIAGIRIMPAPSLHEPRDRSPHSRRSSRASSARARGLLGVELDAEHRAAADDRGERLAVLGAADARPRRRRAAPRTSARGRRGSPRRQPLGQRRRPLEATPRSSRCAAASARRSSKARDLAGDEPESVAPARAPRSARTAAACPGRCRAGRAAPRPRRDQLVQAELAEVAHRDRERADAGHDQPVAAASARRGRGCSRTVAPTRSSAFWTDRRLPIP